MTKKVNTWVRFTYVDVVKKKPRSMLCSVDGCDRPRQRMNAKYFKTRCKEHHAEWLKAYNEHRKLTSR